MGKLLLLITLVLIRSSHSHLIDPQPRSTVNGSDFLDLQNDKTLLNCAKPQKCDTCGNAWNEAHSQEYVGKPGNGIIAKSYTASDSIIATIELTPHREGYVAFHVCPVLGTKDTVTQECLDKNPIQLQNSSETRLHISQSFEGGVFNVSLNLPHNLTCGHCIFQYVYRTANEPAKCENQSISLVGCDAQEEYRQCADIAIHYTSSIKSNEGMKELNETSEEDHLSQPQIPTEGLSSEKQIFRSRRTLGSCGAVNEAKGRDGMDKWCNDNCHHNPPHCPPSHCACEPHVCDACNEKDEHDKSKHANHKSQSEEWKKQTDHHNGNMVVNNQWEYWKNGNPNGRGNNHNENWKNGHNQNWQNENANQNRDGKNGNSNKNEDNKNGSQNQNPNGNNGNVNGNNGNPNGNNGNPNGNNGNPNGNNENPNGNNENPNGNNGNQNGNNGNPNGNHGIETQNQDNKNGTHNQTQDGKNESENQNQNLQNGNQNVNLNHGFQTHSWNSFSDDEHHDWNQENSHIHRLGIDHDIQTHGLHSEEQNWNSLQHRQSESLHRKHQEQSRSSLQHHHQSQSSDHERESQFLGLNSGHDNGMQRSDKLQQGQHRQSESMNHESRNEFQESDSRHYNKQHSQNSLHQQRESLNQESQSQIMGLNGWHAGHGPNSHVFGGQVYKGNAYEEANEEENVEDHYIHRVIHVYEHVRVKKQKRQHKTKKSGLSLHAGIQFRA